MSTRQRQRTVARLRALPSKQQFGPPSPRSNDWKRAQEQRAAYSAKPLESMTKEEMVAYAAVIGVKVYKSWTAGRILATLKENS